MRWIYNIIKGIPTVQLTFSPPQRCGFKRGRETKRTARYGSGAVSLQSGLNTVWPAGSARQSLPAALTTSRLCVSMRFWRIDETVLVAPVEINNQSLVFYLTGVSTEVFCCCDYKPSFGYAPDICIKFTSVLSLLIYKFPVYLINICFILVYWYLKILIPTLSSPSRNPLPISDPAGLPPWLPPWGPPPRHQTEGGVGWSSWPASWPSCWPTAPPSQWASSTQSGWASSNRARGWPPGLAPSCPDWAS